MLKRAKFRALHVSLACVAVVLGVSFLVAPAASAATSVISATTTLSDPSFTSTQCFAGDIPATAHYAAKNVQVATAGTYNFRDQQSVEDGCLFIYVNPFDPAASSANLGGFVDDGDFEGIPYGDVVFGAGNYVFVFFSIGGPDSVGLVDFSVTGPSLLVVESESSTPARPIWHLAVGRASADATCAGNYNPSWAQWPNAGKGGYVCVKDVYADEPLF